MWKVEYVTDFAGCQWEEDERIHFWEAQKIGGRKTVEARQGLNKAKTTHAVVRRVS